MDDPITQVENENVIRNMARLVTVFHTQMLEEGYTDERAWEATLTYLHALGGGKR